MRIVTVAQTTERPVCCAPTCFRGGVALDMTEVAASRQGNNKYSQQRRVAKE